MYTLTKAKIFTGNANPILATKIAKILGMSLGKIEVEHFSDCIINNRKPALSLEDARTNCKIINAALASIKTEQQIKL